MLQELRDLGFHLTFDNVGTGDRALGLLTIVRREFVKADWASTARAGEDSAAHAVWAAINAYAAASDDVVIAQELLLGRPSADPRWRTPPAWAGPCRPDDERQELAGLQMRGYLTGGTQLTKRFGSIQGVLRLARLGADVDVYRVLVENSPEVMFQSVSGAFTWVSPSVVDVLGWTPQDLVGTSIGRLVHPDDREAVLALREGAYAGQTGRTRFRLRTKDHGHRWVETTWAPFADEDGTLGVVGSTRDVTIEVESDLARIELEERFQLIIKNAITGMCLASAEGRINLVNPALCQMLGRDAERLMSSRWQDITHPDDVAADTALTYDLAEGRIPSFRIRKRYLKLDGSVVWGDVSVSCARNHDASVRYFIAQITDVTDRVRMEGALEDSERHYRSLVAGASEALYESGPDHRVTWMSPAVTAILGWSPEDLRGTVLAELVHPDDRRESEDIRAGVFSGRFVWNSGRALRMRTKAGGYRWVSKWSKPELDESGSLVQVVSGLQDIDDLMTTRILLQAMLDTEFDPHAVMAAVRGDTGSIVDFACVEVNPAACEFNRRTREELLGSRALDVLPGLLGTSLVERLRLVVETGEPLRLEDVACEPGPSGEGERRFDVQAARIDDSVSIMWRDVTGRFLTDRALAASEEAHRMLTENLSEVVVRLRDGIVVWATPSLTAALGWSPSDWLDHPVAEFVHPDDLPDPQASRTALNAGELQVFHARVRAADGTYHWGEARAKPFYGQGGNRDGVVASFRAVDAGLTADAGLGVQAGSHELTRLLTRREAIESVAVLTSHARRTGVEAAVLCAEIDGFETIHDTYGQSAGDEVIQTVASRIGACLRSGDLTARFGGDELLVLIDGVHALTDAVDLAARIRRVVSEPIRLGGQRLTTTLSIGVTLAVPGESADDLIARADEARREAKVAGGDRIVPRERESS